MEMGKVRWCCNNRERDDANGSGKSGKSCWIEHVLYNE